MIADADAGKIDIILTKSISRFARNTVDLLENVRHLKSIGVEVRFSREHINTMSADGEVMLTILASFAEAESQSISQNITWAVRKKFQQGEQNGHPRMLGYEWDGEKYNIIPEEAEEVRQIFEAYDSGKSMCAISKMGFKGIDGIPMKPSTVKTILEREFYTGDLILQTKHISSKGYTVRNTGEFPKYLVKDDHEPIISRELFDRVTERRMEKMEKVKSERTETTIFSRKVFCGKCGSSCNRGNGHGVRLWICRNREVHSKSACDAFPTRESDLIEGMNALGITDFERILLYDDRVEFYVSGRKTPLIWKKMHTAYTFRSKIVCGTCGGTCKHLIACNKARDGQPYWGCWNKGCCQHIYEDELFRACDTLFPKQEFRNVVEKAVLYKDRVEFTTKEGEVKTWQRT